MNAIKILALQETNYANEWLGLLKKHNVKAVLIRPNPKLLSIKSYHSYDDSFVQKIYLPFKARGRKVATVGIFEHIYYTIFSFLLLPIALLQDVVLFVTPSYFHTSITPLLKLFRKKVYIIVLDPQEVLKKTAAKNIFFSIYFKIAAFLERMAIMKADKVFVVSTYLRNSYEKLNSHVYYAPSGTDVTYIDGIEPKRMFKETTITYLGSFDYYRGVDILVEAFKKIGQKYKAKLVLLGGGNEEERIKKLAAGSDNIFISGFIPHKKAIAICKGSDILVMPFRNSPILFKTFSLKFFEYVACGVPIIVTDTGEHASWTKKLGAGLVVKNSAEEICAGLEKLVNDKALYRKLKENSRKNKSMVDFKTTRKDFIREFSRIGQDYYP